MAFNGAYSVSQPANSITDIIFTDISTGSDPNLIDRQISLFLTDGSLLDGSVIDWPITDGNTKTLTNILPKDEAIKGVVSWTSSSPIGGSVYNQSTIISFTGYNSLGSYGLTQWEAANRDLTRNKNYFYNKLKLRVHIDNAIEATNYSDQFAAQENLDDAKALLDNKQTFF